MRIGPMIFVAGFGLLCAGVVSTRADAWETEVPARTIELNLDGIDTLDMRDSQIEEVEIASGNAAHLLYPGGKRYRWQNDDETPVAKPSCLATGRTLRCVSSARFMPGEPRLYLPPGSYRLQLNDPEVVAKSGAKVVMLEIHGSAGWKGEAEVLDVRLVAPAPVKGESHCGVPQFAYRKGRVQRLQIRADAGKLDFANLSDVGSIDLQAAPDVGISMDRAADIGRIQILPLAEKSKLSDWKCSRDAAAAVALME